MRPPEVTFSSSEDLIIDDQPPRQWSCTPCRIRKVKCERSPNSTQCLKCIKNEIHCFVATRPPKKQGDLKNRKGRRIDLAKSIFGTGKGYEWDINTPMEEKLQTIQVKTAVTAYLLKIALEQNLDQDLFCDHATIRTSFFKEFQDCGQRLDKMTPETQVFCSILIASSARETSHPVCVGANPPDPDELITVSFGASLSPFGTKREGFCRQLEEHAMKLSDQHGIITRPSFLNMVSLYLVHRMQPWDRRYVPHVWGLVTQARELMDLEETGTAHKSPSGLEIIIRGTPITWIAYLQDSLYAFLRGTAPLLSEEDIERVRYDTPTGLLMMLSPLGQKVACPWSFLFSIWDHVCSTLRKGAESLTGSRARKAPRINEGFVLQFIDDFKLLLAALDTGLSVISKSSNHIEFEEQTSCLRRFRTVAYIPLQIFTDTVKLRLDESCVKIARDNLTTCEIQDELVYQERLKASIDTAEKLLFTATRQLAKGFGEMIDNGKVSASELLVEGATDLLTSIQKRVACLVQTPPTELGGPDDFPFRVKLQELQWFRFALNQLTWKYPCSDDGLRWLDEAITDVERRQEEYASRSSIVSVPSLDVMDSYSLPYDLDLGLFNDINFDAYHREFSAIN